ncbi:MAG: site-2 protease family protein [Candidatus Rokuibacteriota bacterium]|nr:MAG: site-2 protease family protein [Candidatus Rokubacteria bacterium]
MRFWPFRDRRPAGPPPAEDVLVTEALLRENVEDVLIVRERQIRGGVVAFRGDLRVSPSRAVDALLERFRAFGYTPFIRADGDGVVVQAWPLAEVVERPRVTVNVVLFLLTCASTLVAGANFTGSPTFDAFRAASGPAWFLSGVPFACTLLAILGVHEFGHYFTARHYRAQVSLPFFIPAPPPLFLFGTMGAIIRMRSPARDRNSLFDIAAAGPLAGLAVALPAVVIGLSWSTVTPTPPEGYLAFGDSLLIRWLAYLRFGPIPGGSMIFTHPMADAAWAGFLVTALNLFPVGQLDGGRIAYALFGRRHRTVGILTVAGLVLMGVLTWSPNWFVWAALVFFLIGFHHSPPLDDVTPLSLGRRVVGFACFVLMVLLVPPVPIQTG